MPRVESDYENCSFRRGSFRLIAVTVDQSRESNYKASLIVTRQRVIPSPLGILPFTIKRYQTPIHLCALRFWTFGTNREVRSSFDSDQDQAGITRDLFKPPPHHPRKMYRLREAG